MGSASGSSEQNNPALVRSVQQALRQKGYGVGTIDGQLGPTTDGALRNFQQAQGLPQSGALDQQTLSALGVDQNQSSMQGEGAQSSASGSASSHGAQSAPSGSASSQGSQSQGSMQKSPAAQTSGSYK